MINRVLRVPVGDDAFMTIPQADWCWSLRYTRPEPNHGRDVDDRMLSSEVMESFLYLITDCTKEEAWRRIKLMRAAWLRNNIVGGRE